MECLDSVQNIKYPNYDVIVVDNGSTDGSVNAIKKEFPGVTVLENGQNLGFAGGNNIGIRHALNKSTDFILLLNNDTIVDTQLIKNFINAAKSVQQSGIFGAKIYYYSDPEKIWYAGGKWVNEGHCFDHVGMNSIDNGNDFSSITETDYACGCAFFVKADVLNKIGLIDERFFLTFEETDLCYRARKAGYKTFFVPEAKVWHKESVSFGGRKSALFEYFYLRNKLLWAEKNLPVRNQLVIYKKVFVEVLKNILPPRFRLNSDANISLLKRINRSLMEYRESFRKKYENPVRKAKIWGVRDYLLRRFGDCAESVRLLVK